MKTFFTILIGTFIFSAVIVKTNEQDEVKEITEFSEPKVLTHQEVMERTTLYKEILEFEKELNETD